jgi:hypothetical protein
MNLLGNDYSTIELPKTINPARQKWTDAQRQNWFAGSLAARRDPPALWLGERCLIQDCSKSLLMLFGFRLSDLVW